MPAQFEVEPSSAALEKRATLSVVVPPGTTGNDFAAKEGQPGNLVIITGGNKMEPYMGIGPAVGIELARRGMDNIVITSTTKPESEAQARKAAELMANEGAKVYWRAVDHTQRADNIALIEAIYEQFGNINYLVGNAGAVRLSPTFRVKYDQIDADVATMLMSNYHLCKTIAERNHKNGTPQEFKAAAFTGSIVAHESTGWQTGYAMAKAGLIGLVSDLGAEFGEHTRFNVVEFGFIRTHATRRLHESPAGQEFAAKRVAVKRIGEPQEAAKVIAFLLSDDASYVNRAVLRADGGLPALAQ